MNKLSFLKTTLSATQHKIDVITKKIQDTEKELKLLDRRLTDARGPAKIAVLDRIDAGKEHIATLIGSKSMLEADKANRIKEIRHIEEDKAKDLHTVNSCVSLFMVTLYYGGSLHTSRSVVASSEQEAHSLFLTTLDKVSSAKAEDTIKAIITTKEILSESECKHMINKEGLVWLN